MEFDDEAEHILNEARDSIGNFCINECKAYCCKKGYLVLTRKQMKATMQDKEEDYRRLGLLTEMTGDMFSLHMGEPGYPCPSLKDNMCSIHKNPDRCTTCHSFPIWLFGEKIHISNRCFAGKESLFYPYIARLVKLGFKVEKD